MSLVHSTDENREQIMNYVAELDTMQEKKLGMIEKLRVVSVTEHHRNSLISFDHA